jgi:hypothetical protein
MFIKREIFGFHFLPIYCLSLYKKWANPPLNICRFNDEFTIEMSKRWAKDKYVTSLLLKPVNLYQLELLKLNYIKF